MPVERFYLRAGLIKRRWLVLISLLVFEFAALIYHFEVPELNGEPVWSIQLFQLIKTLWPAILWIVFATLIVFSPKLKFVINDISAHAVYHSWKKWLVLQVFAFIFLTIVTSYLFGLLSTPKQISVFWLLIWIVLIFLTVFFWFLALAPSDFWLLGFRRHYQDLGLAVILGVSAWLLVDMFYQQEAPLGQKEFWEVLAKPTFDLVYFFLGWFFSELVYEPENLILGTSSFYVRISYACSGIEGISLISIFIALYLWLFRKTLRFPQVFILFPLGILFIWLSNAMRIALLVAIGTLISPDIALRGFHEQAGWVAFTLIAVAAIALSHKLHFFNVSKSNATVQPDVSSLATALLSPFLALMATRMITSATSSGFIALYPLQVAVVAITLFYFRKFYRGLGWQWSWYGPAIGVFIFAIWIFLEPDLDDNKNSIAWGLSNLSSPAAATWLFFRTAGSIVTVPLAEELAFRGYLIRKLIKNDFENAPLGQFTWFSFIASSILFGLMHERWLAGVVAGMAYALALYRRGHIGDAVIAHMTTNALIAIVVLSQHKWSLWS